MNTFCVRGTFLFIFFLIPLFVTTEKIFSQPQPVCQWTFDDPTNLAHAITGKPLDLIGEQTPVKGIGDTDGAVSIGAGNYYLAWYDIAPNGGQNVNQYTLVFDFLVPELNTWYCFYNTNTGNNNDGDTWIAPAGQIGVDATGYSDFTISPGVWHRFAITVDLTVGVVEYFINGDSIHQSTGQQLDGRFSLNGSDSDSPYMILFAYDTASDLLMDISMVSLYDKPLTPAEISSLGGPQSVSQVTNLGDVTGDRVVDGRDALKILRDSKGLETVSPGNRDAGDVYPFPGVNGRAIGDDALTSDDAQKILDYSVGLISADELAGNLTKLTPRIDDVLPGRAGIGGLVAIEGANFLVGEAEYPKVFFNGLPAEVIETSNPKITVRVPKGATNGPIKVETVIGTTQTSEDFIIVPKTDGVLDLGEGLNPEDFIVVSGMDETVSNADGSFQLTTIPEYVSIVGAVPKGDGDNSFLALFIPGVSDLQDQSFKIDADATARALVYMHPFFMSKEIPAAKWMMSLMEDAPEIDDLAKVIRERYPQGANGLEDADVEGAWSKAVIALVDAIPDTVSYDVEGNALVGKTALFNHSPFHYLSNNLTATVAENTGEDSLNPHILQVETRDGDTPEIFHVDREYIAAKYDSDKQGLDIYLSNNNFCPVDWVVRLYRADPKEFSLGWNTPYEEIATTPYTHLDYKLTTVVAARQWTALIDLVREGFNYVFDRYKSETVLNLQADSSNSNYLADDSVYLLRCANGAFRDHDPRQWDFKVLKSQNSELYNQHLKARAVNILLILCDVWSLFSDENSSVYKQAVVAAIKNNTSSLSSKVVELDNQDIESQSTLNRFLDILLDTSKGFAQTFLEHGMSNAGDKVQNQLKSVFSSCSAITAFLSKASTLGRIAERGVGLGGLAFGAREQEEDYGVTPLETFQIVVGDPFNPVIDSFSPQLGAVGDEITIVGKHFYPQRTKVYLSKYFEYEYFENEAVPVEIINAAENQLKVKVPEGLYPFETYNFIVRTPAFSSKYGRNEKSCQGDFTYIPAPRIANISPVEGFSNQDDNPYFNDFEGTQITITGTELLLDNFTEYVLIGSGNGDSVFASILERSNTELIVRVPPGLDPGEKELYLENPRLSQYPDTWEKTPPIPFTVIDVPALDEISTQNPQSGEWVSIKGKNLQQAICVLDDTIVVSERMSETGIRFAMPAGEEDEVLKLVIWNPTGPSNERAMTREPGFEITPPGKESTSLFVRIFANPASYQISLNEAAAFSRGGINLILEDDDNIKEIREYHPDGSYTVLSRTVMPPNQFPQTHEYRAIYRIGEDEDGNTVYHHIYTEDLDEEEPEEYKRHESGTSLEKADYIFTGRQDFDRDTYDSSIEHEEIFPDGGGGGNTFSIQNLHIGSGDVLNMYGHNLSMDSILFEENNIFNLNEVTCSSQIKIDKNYVIFESGTFKGLNDPILIENSLGNLIENVTVENSAKNAFHIVNSGGNKIECNIVSPNQGGIFIDGGGENSVGANIKNAGSYGVRVENSHDNFFTGNMDGCSDYGICVYEGQDNEINMYISNSNAGVQIFSTQNNVITCNVSDCSIGFEMDDSTGNYLNGNAVACGSGLHVYDCGLNTIVGGFSGNGTGIFLDDYCINNYLSPTVYGNETGMIVEGENTHSNKIQYAGYGKYINWDTSKYDVIGNTGYGLHIRSGAHNNTVNDCEFYGCGNHAVLIEGDGSDSNVIRDCHFGAYFSAAGMYEEDETWVNHGDGIRISGGAQLNKLLDVYIGKSKGNGITITGENTNFNEIASSSTVRTIIGCQQNGDDDNPPLSNEGWGIVVEDGALGTKIDGVVLGVNKLGGLFVKDINSSFSQEQKSLTVHNLSVGYSNNADHVFAFPFADTFGNGVQIENSSNLLFMDCDAAYHGIGFWAYGENLGDITISDLDVRLSEKQGLLIDGGSGYYLNQVVASGCRNNGMQFQFLQDLLFVGLLSTSQSNQGHGILIDSCENIRLRDMQIGPENSGNGVHIVHSSATKMKNVRSNENNGHGLFVGEGAVDAAFYKGEALGNNLDGIHLENCSDFWLHGTGHTRDLFVHGNGRHAVQIDNAQNVYVGKNDEGGYFSGEDYPAVLIQGVETKNVHITANTINGQQDAPGVHVAGGKNIAIGSPDSGEGNYFTNNNGAGILAEGENTSVTIVGNQIGDRLSSSEPSNGNEIGIVLQGDIEGAKITNNLINANRTSGIVIQGGAEGNEIEQNTISNNGRHGIRAESENARGNRISNNSIYDNDGEGVSISGDAVLVSPPIVQKVDADSGKIYGACAAPVGSIIQVFADRGNEGRYFVGSARLLGNEFVVYGDAPRGYNLNAIAIDPDGHASEFGLMNLLDDTGERDSYVYTYNSESSLDIYLSDPTVSEHVQLTREPADDYSPRFSQDGSQVLFVSERSGNPDLWLMNNDGSNLQQITSDPRADYDPDWIGDHIVFVSERDGNPEIYTQPAATVGGAGGGEISYSDQTPDYGYDFAAKDEAIGQQFTARAPGTLNRLGFYINGGLAEFGWKVLNWDGAKPGDTVLAEGVTTPTEIGWHYVDIDAVSVAADFVVALYFLSDSKPAPGFVITGSQERTWIFDRMEWIKGYNIVLFKAFLEASSSATRLTYTDSIDRYPSVSPDRSKIAFASDRSGTMDIWVMDANGSNPIRLTHGEGVNTKPDWSPDGERIAFVSTRSGSEDIFVMDAGGQNLKQVTDSQAVNTDPSWHQRGKRILFCSDRDEGMELYIVDISSLNVVRMTDLAGDCSQPDAGPAFLPQPAGKIVVKNTGILPNQLDGEGYLSIQSGEAMPGETIVLAVDLSNAQELGNLAFDIQFDGSVMKLVDMPLGAVIQGGLHAHNPLDYPADVDFVRFDWIRAEGFTGDGNVMQLEFQVNSLAQQGENPIELQNISAYNILLNEIPISSANAILTVVSPETDVKKWMLYN